MTQSRQERYSLGTVQAVCILVRENLGHLSDRRTNLETAVYECLIEIEY